MPARPATDRILADSAGNYQNFGPVKFDDLVWLGILLGLACLKELLQGANMQQSISTSFSLMSKT